MRGHRLRGQELVPRAMGGRSGCLGLRPEIGNPPLIRCLYQPEANIEVMALLGVTARAQPWDRPSRPRASVVSVRQTRWVPVMAIVP